MHVITDLHHISNMQQGINFEAWKQTEYHLPSNTHTRQQINHVQLTMLTDIQTKNSFHIYIEKG